ncbi:hypothetical protein BC940DRAFT_293078 [Gongronella butleri]|nr:hypothetical protein BC940DRAFT_293078 [Gongronella butleri]
MKIDITSDDGKQKTNVVMAPRLPFARVKSFYELSQTQKKVKKGATQMEPNLYCFPAIVRSFLLTLGDSKACLFAPRRRRRVDKGHGRNGEGGEKGRTRCPIPCFFGPPPENSPPHWPAQKQQSRKGAIIAAAFPKGMTRMAKLLISFFCFWTRMSGSSAQRLCIQRTNSFHFLSFFILGSPHGKPGWQ